MSSALNSDFFSSETLGPSERRSKRYAILIAVSIAFLSWVIDSLFDAFFFHEDSLVTELFSPSHRELSMRLTILFGAAFFTYFYLRLRHSKQRLKFFEQELKRSHVNLSEAQRIAHLGSYVWNLKTGAAEFSDEIYRLYGLKVGDTSFTTEQSIEKLHPDDQARVRTTIEECIFNKTPHSSEHRILLPNGIERWIHCQGEFVLDSSGEPIRMLGTIRDITASKKAELNRKSSEQELKKTVSKLKDANKLKDLFSDVLSHDLMNPAAAIKITTELLLKVETDPTKVKIINGIHKSTERLIDLCSNASKYAKISSAQQLEFSEHDLSSLFKRVLRDLDYLFAEKQIKIHADLKNEHLAQCNLMITDVFSNLISNAIKYSPEGSAVGVNIRDEGDAWVVSICDQGEGIPNEFKDQIFNRFVRVGKSGVKGTGLGLAIAKGIVDLHGGKIWIEDNPGRGSVFCVKLYKKIPASILNE